MKELKEFLSCKDVRSSLLFARLECSYDEALLIKGLCESYFSGISMINAHALLSSIWQGHAYLDKISLISTLEDKDLVVLNPSVQGLGLIHSDLSPSQNLLCILANKPLKLRLEKRGFGDLNSYLGLQFLRLDLVLKIAKVKNHEAKKKLRKKLKNLEQNLKERLALSKNGNVLEELFKEYGLDYNERLIILALLKEEYSLNQGGLDSKALSELCTKKNSLPYLKEGQRLQANNLIEFEELYSSDFLKFSKMYFLGEAVIERVLNPKKKLASKLQALVDEQEIFELIEPKADFKEIIMPSQTKAIFENIIKQRDKR